MSVFYVRFFLPFFLFYAYCLDESGAASSARPTRPSPQTSGSQVAADRSEVRSTQSLSSSVVAPPPPAALGSFCFSPPYFFRWSASILTLF